MTAASLLQVSDLSIDFRTDAGVVPAVSGVSFEVGRGECLGIVGESGSGKSVSVSSLLGLLPRDTALRRSGTALFDGVDLYTLRSRELDRIRGNRIGMIFQDPMSSFNPVTRIGTQVAEVIRTHDHRVTKRAALARVAELFDQVGIPDPAMRVRQYPHELSGGMRQRAMIAMAIANDPALIIADEPTTALDVTVQAQVLELLRDLQRERDISMILITHDLGVIAEMADRVVVMRGGCVVEEADVFTLFEDPASDYTRELLECRPRMSSTERRLRGVGVPLAAEEER
ncbi:ABC transporter ATP-binding protein [Microbacterium sp. ZW T5_56]|uniref:ABC transporter ATP-binding protein n=1 Tax=Microbacterium sp. ZW T5_56 TaxID=3378081 RepID=UPI003852DB48